MILDRIRYYNEKFNPYAIAALVTFLLFYYKQYFVAINPLTIELAKNAISVCGTLLGFLLTILTIINTITTRSMRFIKQSGAFENLMGYLKTAIFCNIIVIVFALLYVSLDLKALPIKIAQILPYFFIFSMVVSLACSVRFSRLFITIFSDKSEN